MARSLVDVGEPELAGGVAESVVPLSEGREELAGAPPLEAQIPRLHDELEVAEQLVGTQCVQERMVWGEHALEPRQRDGEVESEAVYAYALGPVPQRIHGECDVVGVGEVHGVAAAGGVFELAGMLGLLAVEREIVEPTPADARPGIAALAGVVVHHVHDHLEAGFMQGAYHVDHLTTHGGGTGLLSLLRGITGLREKKLSVE